MKKSLLAALPLLAIALTGCDRGRSGSSSSVTLTIWEDASNIEKVKEIAKEFVAQYKATYPEAPKIEFKYVEQTEKSAVEKMNTVASTGNGPDIAAVTHDTIASGVDNKVIAPATYADGVKSRMTEEALNAVTYDDTVYGYPITAESQTIMYDSTKVSASELASLEALKASGKKLSWNVTGDNGGYYSWGLCNDSVLFGASGKDASDVDIAKPNAVKNVTDFFKNYLGNIVDETPENGVASVQNGVTVGVVTSPFLLKSMQNAIGENLKLAKLPTIGGQELRPFSGYKAYVVSRYSKNPSIAQEFCNYLTSVDSNEYRLSEAGYLPAVPLDANEGIKELVKNDENAKVYAQSLELSMVMPNIPEMNNFWKPMNNANSGFKKDSATLTESVVQSKLNEVTTTLLGN